jgi:hypothetical protein
MAAVSLVRRLIWMSFFDSAQYRSAGGMKIYREGPEPKVLRRADNFFEFTDRPSMLMSARSQSIIDTYFSLFATQQRNSHRLMIERQSSKMT